MKSRLLQKLDTFKRHAREIGLGKFGWINVLADFLVARYCYGFSKDDYFVKGNGYTLSKYEKKRFFTLKKAFWLQDRVNDSDFVHLPENKVEALSLFNNLVSRGWLYVTKSTLAEFVSFAEKFPVFIAKPVAGMCGEGIKNTQRKVFQPLS